MGEATEMVWPQEGEGWRVVKALHPRLIAREWGGDADERTNASSVWCVFRPPGRRA